MKKLTLILILLALILSACIVQPPPTPTAVRPTPTPKPATWLLQCDVEKCKVFIQTGTNSSGAPIIDLNSGTYFVIGDRVEYIYPCIQADGGTVWCEIYRDQNGNYYPSVRFNRRTDLVKVY